MRFRDAPEVRFFKSPAGVATAVGASVAIGAALVAWARRGDREERRKRLAMLGAATGASVLSKGFMAIAEKQGWFGGNFSKLPGPVRFMFEWPVGIGYNALWLSAYRALTADARHPLWIFGAVAAGAMPGAIAGGRVELSRGYYTMGHGWRLGYNALF